MHLESGPAPLAKFNDGHFAGVIIAESAFAFLVSHSNWHLRRVTVAIIMNYFPSPDGIQYAGWKRGGGGGGSTDAVKRCIRAANI